MEDFKIDDVNQLKWLLLVAVAPWACPAGSASRTSVTWDDRPEIPSNITASTRSSRDGK